eukprot:429415-Pyramimonas_sp.AAC.1
MTSPSPEYHQPALPPPGNTPRRGFNPMAPRPPSARRPLGCWEDQAVWEVSRPRACARACAAPDGAPAHGRVPAACSASMAPRASTLSFAVETPHWMGP